MQLKSQIGLPVDIMSKSRGAVATPFQVIAQSQSVDSIGEMSESKTSINGLDG